MKCEFRQILAQHLARYPLMQPQDCAKLAYQSEFGPEHMAPGREQALHALQGEWSGEVQACGPHPPESIGNGLCRFYLTGEYPPALAAPLLAELFLLTAKTHTGTMQGLLDKLELLDGLDVPGMGEWLGEYRRQGCPPIHHTQVYRTAYHPHYRLVTLAYAGWFPALMEVARLAQSGRTALVAIDGRCGSGKTGLAGLIAQLFCCNVFHMDDFYLPLEQRAPDWQHSDGGNLDFDRFQEEVLRPVMSGEAVQYRPFCCRSGSMGEAVTVPARALNIVEGSYSHHPVLHSRYDLKIFLTCSKQEQARRLKAREGEHFAAFEQRWIPMEEQYVQRCNVEAGGDLVLDTSRFFSL